MISPIFYSDFNCTASKCRHSCCRGWEIDVDPDTAYYYREIEGELGERLRANLVNENGEYHFRLTEDERCPFLKKDGLCEVILGLGEEALCDICALHPRFFFEIKKTGMTETTNAADIIEGDTEYETSDTPEDDTEYETSDTSGDDTEYETSDTPGDGIEYKSLDTPEDEIEFAGLGLTCEEVTRLLLSEDDKLLFINDEGESYTIESILEMLGYKSGNVHAFRPDPERSKYEKILKLFSKTEPIDQEWTEMMAGYMESVDDITERCRKALPDFDQIKFQRIYDYILYRQLERLCDTDLFVLQRYAEVCCEFIYICSTMTGDLPESIRRFSEQIEYSTENVDIIKANERKKH